MNDLLHHPRLGAVAVERLDDAAQVQPIGLDPKDAHAPHAVERLEDDVAMLGMKGPDLGLVARDQGR